MLIRRKNFSCPDTRVASGFTYGDTVALQEPAWRSRNHISRRVYGLAIDTGILHFEAVDLGFHDSDIDAGILLFEALEALALLNEDVDL